MKNKEDSLVGNIQSILNENKFKNAIKKFEGLSSEYNGIEICKEKIREYS